MADEDFELGLNTIWSGALGLDVEREHGISGRGEDLGDRPGHHPG